MFFISSMNPGSVLEGTKEEMKAFAARGSKMRPLKKLCRVGDGVRVTVDGEDEIWPVEPASSVLCALAMEE